MSDATLNAINRAAKDLPWDWHIEVHVELGSGWVELYDYKYERREFPSNRESLRDEINDAIDFAIKYSKEQ